MKKALCIITGITCLLCSCGRGRGRNITDEDIVKDHLNSNVVVSEPQMIPEEKVTTVITYDSLKEDNYVMWNFDEEYKENIQILCVLENKKIIYAQKTDVSYASGDLVDVNYQNAINDCNYSNGTIAWEFEGKPNFATLMQSKVSVNSMWIYNPQNNTVSMVWENKN